MLRTVLLGLGLVATGLCILLAYIAYAALSMIVELSDSYIKFTPSGVHTLETQLRQDGHPNVRLVGMMHFGATASYDKLYRSFAKPQSLILEEGISDRQRPTRTSYRCAAQTTLSVTRSVMEQPSLCIIDGAHRVASVSAALGGPGVDIVNADVYLQELSPQTQEWITLNLDLLKKFTTGDLRELDWRYVYEQLSNPIPEQVWDDILYARNDRVIDSFQLASEHYNHVVIPWGAMHGPGLQQSLLELGFTATDSKYHLILPWSALLNALR